MGKRVGDFGVRVRGALPLVLLTCTLCSIGGRSVSSQAATPQIVTEVWVHDVPGPPQGDSWDSALSSVVGLLAGQAGIYPDVMVCASPFSGGARSCASVCWDLQGDATLGGRQRSTQCRQPIRVSLAAGDPRLQIEVFEIDGNPASPRTRAAIARGDVANPSSCPHDRPCEMSTPQGPVVLSFSTQTAAAPAPPRPPARRQAGADCEPPSPTWEPRHLTPELGGLHGPYATVDEAMKNDSAGIFAWQLTGPEVKFSGTGTREYGFVILRDTRRQKGGYYTTPPVPSSVAPSAGRAPQFPWSDYTASRLKAFVGSCEKLEDFTIAATVHTHPFPLYWGWEPFFIDNFSMDDFNQAIQLKTDAKSPAPHFEKIFMINARDRAVRVFEPRADDRQNMFTADEKSSYSIFVSRNEKWLGLIKRVTPVGYYPAPQ